MVSKEIIKIEQDNKTEAEFMSRSFIDKAIKNRAYINALGAELVVKYLTENGISIGELHSIHSISRILEKIDISDILLPNIHIDVRIVFDDDKIFIPKNHFELDIKPDIYVVAKLNSDFDSVELLGYIESGKVSFENSDDEYYFIEKDALESVKTLINYVKNFSRNRDRSLSDEEMLKAREMSVSMADHDISEKDFKKLLSMLLESDALRNSLLEFDNFELLSYNAVAFIPEKLDSQNNTGAVLTESDNTDSLQDSEAEAENAVSAQIAEDEEAITDFAEDFQTFTDEDEINKISESLDEELISEPITDDIEDNLIEEGSSLLAEEPTLETEINSNISEEEMSEPDILDLEEPVSEKDDDSKGINIGGAIVSGAAAIGGAAAAASAMGAAGATAAAGAGAIEAAAIGAGADVVGMGMAAATDEAIKLAGMAEGVKEEIKEEVFEAEKLEDVVSDTIDENIPEISLDEPNMEISEEVHNIDNIEGIVEDFNSAGEEVSLPEAGELSDMPLPENAESSFDAIELPQDGENSENLYDDDIFSQFVQESGDDISNLTSETTEPSEEGMMSFEQLEQIQQAPSAPVEVPEITLNDNSEEYIPVIANSSVISDKTFSVGEIPIDINKTTDGQEPIQEELEDIYNPEYAANNSSMLNNNVRIIKNNPNQSGKNPLIPIVLASAVILGLGFAAFKFIKPAQQTPEPVVDDYVPENTEDTYQEDPNTLKVDKNNVVDMNKNNSSVVPSVPGQNIVRQSKPISPTAYIRVSKISWEVPDYVSYSPQFRQYFQSAGRSIKLALTSDLLLATEYPYSNQVKVSASFNKGGSFTEARIVQSSGSSEIDKIVLQTVNQTLKVLKAPPSLRDDDNTTAILKIYF